MNRTKDGASIEVLIRMAIPLLKEAERQCPRTGRGAKPKIPDWFLGALIMVAVLMRKKSKSAQFRWFNLPAHRQLVLSLAAQPKLPARSTYFDRYRRAHRLFEKAIEVQGRRAIRERLTDPKYVAADKSIVRARGPAWNQRDRQKGKRPRGVDPGGTWGFSKHHGWVYGYSFEVVVTATPNTTVFPLLASAHTASAAEVRTFIPKIAALPPKVTAVLADSGYDANRIGELVEYNPKGNRTGRRYLCPENPRNDGRSKTKPCYADAARLHSRQLRAKRKSYYESRIGRKIYRRRTKTVEPFNSWLKSLFSLDQRAWQCGLENNQTQFLTSIFTYQLLVRYNHKRGRKNSRLKTLIDSL